MGRRLHRVVALTVVLSSFYALNNEQFIIRSFRDNANEDALGQHTPGEEARPSSAIPAGNLVGRTDSDNHVAYRFCPYCPFNYKYLCIEYVEWLAAISNISVAQAMNSASVPERCATSDIAHNTYAEKDEPSVILHVGPHKTGTTALQSFIYDLMKANETVFARDRIRVPSDKECPGYFEKEGAALNLAHCSLEKYKSDGGQMNSADCMSLRRRLPKLMKDAYNKSQDFLLVAEDFDRVAINIRRLHFFLRPYKKIKVAVVYRRLHDWLPSFYNQIVGDYALVYAKGETTFPSFVEWLDKNYDAFIQVHAIKVAERYRGLDSIESVDLINMNEVVSSGVSIEQFFFCDHLHAKATCRAIKDGARASKLNIGTDHEYQRLLIASSLRGKIGKTFSRRQHLNRMTRRLKEKVEDLIANKTLPRVCPQRSQLEKILETEIGHERTHFADWLESSGGEDALRRSFELAVEKKFCSLDIDAIFDSGLLDPIFSNFR